MFIPTYELVHCCQKTVTAAAVTRETVTATVTATAEAYRE
jgi:hypothetical protein